ncbi:glycosyltransferase family 2 protein [Actibacterium sp. D379-3]
MKLFVQIPAFNEEGTLATVIEDIRTATAGLDASILVIDDGSTDRTVEVALASGADWVAQHPQNAGLARAWQTGLTAAINLGADIIVNTDADNQYNAECIPNLIHPIEEGQADMVVGARPISDTAHFSPMKKRLQNLGSSMARRLSGTSVADAPSGFRAMSRETAIHANVFTNYTYTLETLIQAGRSGLRVVSVPIRVNGPTRPSRLISSMWRYVVRSARDMVRIFTIYAPLRSYFIASVTPLVLALALAVRYGALVVWVDPSRSHAPSLIFAATLAMLAFLLMALGVIGDLLSVNRRLLEDLRLATRRQQADQGALRGRTAFRLLRKDGTEVEHAATQPGANLARGASH